MSTIAMASGLTTATIQSIIKLLNVCNITHDYNLIRFNQELCINEPQAKIGIVSFTSNIQFYSIRHDKAEPFGNIYDTEMI
jgi:hypothetical protein